ncbi:hypothetical protein B566_EDAN009825 [Ephemera danica]|nr:hypothetical protein B566_EDAN009825 [Ephemera danica]
MLTASDGVLIMFRVTRKPYHGKWWIAARPYSSELRGKVMAIRREDQSVWERRAPLSPSNVKRLTRAGVKVIVQPSNRRAYPMQNIRLIDYEKLMDERGQRVVAFGKYAGVAGMVNILHGLGLRLLALGHHTPFMHIGPAHNYRSSFMARQAIRDAGYEIALGMMPKSVGPLTFVFTGSGNVSQGAQEVFQELPFDRRDHLERIEGGGYDAHEYDQHPYRYLSTFSKTIAPYASVLINGIYWAVDSPKLLTIPDAKYLLRPAHTPWLPIAVGAPALPHRMLAICDISADPGGSIEFMNECTTIDTPFCLYDADRNKDTKSFKGPGVLVCSIDNMPTQLPREATDFFGDLLLPYAMDILKSDAYKPLEKQDLSHTVHGATIASNGSLTPNYEYIQELRNSNKSRHKASDVEQKAKRVLILGAGFVSAPVVEYLSREKNLHITLASALKDEADAVAERHGGSVEPMLLDVVARPDLLEKYVKSSDIVVSLLPYSLHPTVAQSCIDSDPGLDHLLALECFAEVRQAGGKVESFISHCGGLPAPEFSNNPLRYKFSWSPRGVLLNTLSSAKYIRQNQLVEIPAGGALMESVESLNFLPGFALEGFPNRDSTVYKELYGLSGAHTVLRGTLRFRGFADSMKGLQVLGLLAADPHPALHPNGPDITWRQLVSTLMELPDTNLFYDNLKSAIFERLGQSHLRVDAIEQLGLLTEDLPEERDLVVLRHEIGILWPDGRRELRGINVVTYGDINGYSAMSKTVGYPAAIAARMVLDEERERTAIYI